MTGSLMLDSFDEGRDWVFNRDRTRAAIWYDTGHPRDAFGTGTDLFVEVWDAVSKQRLAYRWLAAHSDSETGQGDGSEVCGVGFSDDERTLIIQHSDGSETLATFPFYPAESAVITEYVNALRAALTEEQMARVESIDTTGTGEPVAIGSNKYKWLYDELTFLMADAACRRFAPRGLDAAGHPDIAADLSGLPPITSTSAAESARDLCDPIWKRWEQGLTRDLLAAAAHAAIRAVDAEASAGEKAGRCAVLAQELVGAGTGVLDGAIDLLPDAVSLAHELPRPEAAQSLVDGTRDVLELQTLARSHSSTEVRRLAGRRLEELGVEVRKRLERDR